MGQSLRSEGFNMSKRKYTVSAEPRFPDIDILNNGLIFNEIVLPNEVIALILSYVGNKDLLKTCLLVCRNWRDLIQNDVWKLKAEREYSHRLKCVTGCRRLDSLIYQGICCKDGYNRNLLKNNSGQAGLKHWEIMLNGGDRWKTEKPPVGVCRPTNANYEEPEVCFATSYTECKKRQIVDLKKCGVHPSVLDTYQPDIVVSEWCAARWDCGSRYILEVDLTDANKKILKTFSCNEEMRDWMNGWQGIKHTFKDYRAGVRYIIFSHSGQDLRFWAGHYGSKMANAQVLVDISNINVK